MPACNDDDQELQQKLNEMTYERDEAVAEAGVLNDEVTRLRQLLAVAVLVEGGQIKIERSLLESASDELLLRMVDLTTDSFVLSVKQ